MFCFFSDDGANVYDFILVNSKNAEIHFVSKTGRRNIQSAWCYGLYPCSVNLWIKDFKNPLIVSEKKKTTKNISFFQHLMPESWK